MVWLRIHNESGPVGQSMWQIHLLPCLKIAWDLRPMGHFDSIRPSLRAAFISYKCSYTTWMAKVLVLDVAVMLARIRAALFHSRPPPLSGHGNLILEWRCTMPNIIRLNALQPVIWPWRKMLQRYSFVLIIFLLHSHRPSPFDGGWRYTTISKHRVLILNEFIMCKFHLSSGMKWTECRI